MILHIDHIVVPATRVERDELADRLERAGFVRVDSGRSDENQVEHHLLAFAGGAFLELVCEIEPGSCPLPELFSVLPRVAGVGFTSNDLDRDMQTWTGDEDAEAAWYWEHDWFDQEGRQHSYRAAGPIPVGRSYLFLMDGEQTVFSDVDATPRLREIRFRGTAHRQWRHRYQRWLELESKQSFDVGGVSLSFEEGQRPGIEIGLTFDVSSGGGSVRLAESSIELRGPRDGG